MAGISARQVAKLANISDAYPSLLESGERGKDRVGAEVVLGLARVFGVTPEWLLMGEGDAPKRDQVLDAVRRASGEAA